MNKPTPVQKKEAPRERIFTAQRSKSGGGWWYVNRDGRYQFSVPDHLASHIVWSANMAPRLIKIVMNLIGLLRKHKVEDPEVDLAIQYMERLSHAAKNKLQEAPPASVPDPEDVGTIRIQPEKRGDQRDDEPPVPV